MTDSNATVDLSLPVFLVGAERSGTTLLRLMLDSHPQITWQSEFEFAVDCIAENGDWPPLEEYYHWLNKDRIFLDTQFEVDKSLAYPDLIKSFLAQKAAQSGSDIIGATCHRHFDRLLSIWPNARFIHILRDPRDVANSNIGMGWAGNVWYGIDRWITAERTWEQLTEKVDPRRRFEFHYEDLIVDPQQTLSDICRFLGPAYHPDMLSYNQTSTYSAPDKDLTYQWQKKLSDQQVKLIEHKAANLLEQRGYQPSGLAMTAPGWLLRRKLWLHDIIATKSFRIKRFGLISVASNFIGRRLHLARLENWSLRRMHAAERLTLK